MGSSAVPWTPKENIYALEFPQEVYSVGLLGPKGNSGSKSYCEALRAAPIGDLAGALIRLARYMGGLIECHM